MMKNPYSYTAVNEAGLPSAGSDLVEQYSQHSEDLVIAGLLEAWVSAQKGKMSDLTYLEIGANHPIVINSTFLFYNHYKMRGVLIEANPDLIKTLQKTRPDDVVINAAITNEDKAEVTLIVPEAHVLATIVPEHLEAWQYGGADNQRQVSVKAQRINDILEQHFADAPPAYMSIDIEGHDLEILADMDFEKFRPLIIQIESSNHLIPDHDKQICAFMQSKNYHLIARISINLIFVSDNFFQTLPPPRALTGLGANTLAAPQYFTKKYSKKRHRNHMKTVFNFIKSYFLFPWYVYKTYKKLK